MELKDLLTQIKYEADACSIGGRWGFTNEFFRLCIGVETEDLVLSNFNEKVKLFTDTHTQIMITD